MVSCTLTALAVLTAGGGRVWSSGVGAQAMTLRAFGSVFGECAVKMVSVFILFFALTSIFGWALYGEKSVAYLLPEKRGAVRCFRWACAAAAVCGAMGRLETIWALADVLSGLMTVVNAAALILLTPTALCILRRYDKGLAAQNKRGFSVRSYKGGRARCR